MNGHVNEREIGSAVVSGQVSDLAWACHEFEPSATKDTPCKGAMHLKSVERVKRPSVGVVVRKGGQLRCHPRHLTMV
ncbi:hypothetical protein TNCV_2153961 [Trichonephila clavipes]|nr:hypothetical protein TNCV_2153961 [Trichonephila clavipes]